MLVLICDPFTQSALCDSIFIKEKGGKSPSKGSKSSTKGGKTPAKEGKSPAKPVFESKTPKRLGSMPVLEKCPTESHNPLKILK